MHDIFHFFRIFTILNFNRMKELRNHFESKGDTLYLVSDTNAIEFLNGSIENDFISCLRQISSNGIFNTLVECCKPNKLGFDITTDSEYEEEDFLYDETKYKAIVAVKEDQEEDFANYMFNQGIDIILLGHVTKGELRVDDESYGFISKY